MLPACPKMDDFELQGRPKLASYKHMAITEQAGRWVGTRACHKHLLQGMGSPPAALPDAAAAQSSGHAVLASHIDATYDMITVQGTT